MRLTAATICSIGCEQMCFCSAFVSRSDPAWGSGGMPPSCSPIVIRRSESAFHTGSYAGSSRLRPCDRIGSREHAAEPELVVHAQHLGGSSVGILQREHADAEQPVAVSARRSRRASCCTRGRSQRRSSGRARCSQSRRARTTGRGTRDRRPRCPCRRVGRRRRSRARTRRGTARRTWPRCVRHAVPSARGCVGLPVGRGVDRHAVDLDANARFRCRGARSRSDGSK